MTFKNVNFTKFSDRGYHHIIEPVDYMYFITFANRNADVKIYFIVDDVKYYFKTLKTNEDENNIIITITDILKSNYDDHGIQNAFSSGLFSIDICTNHKVTKCKVMYNDIIPT